MNKIESCKTCRHWNSERTLDGKKYLGSCTFINEATVNSDADYAFLEGDTYAVSLLVGPDFGCVKHQAIAEP